MLLLDQSTRRDASFFFNLFGRGINNLLRLFNLLPRCRFIQVTCLPPWLNPIKSIFRNRTIHAVNRPRFWHTEFGSCHAQQYCQQQ